MDRASNGLTEYVLTIDGKEQCPECGHLWTDEGAAHYHDCRYFFLDGEGQEDDFVTEDAIEAKHLPTLKTAA
jgi:hypothetical protein